MFEILHGFRDFRPEACANRNIIFSGWRTVAHNFGFEEFDCPILESLDLFTKKSGEEIAEQLFAFEDRGGRKIALRPETTPSLTRILGEHYATLKRPTKWFNITENFRYERPQKGRLRSFYQFNVDIVGEASYSAEAELLALAIESFQHFGLTREQFYIRLSDRQLWTLWLQAFEIEEDELKTKMLSLFDKWERRSQKEIIEDLKKVLGEAFPVEDFCAATEKLRNAHTLQEIEACFYAQTQAENLRTALRNRLDDFQRLLKEVDALGYKSFIMIDLTIVRGLAYYTGFVFEVFETGNQGRALAGGGRYDQLFEKLIGKPMPAVGFAAGDVTLTDLLQKNQLLPDYVNTVEYALVFEATERYVALGYAQKLRNSGHSVIYSLGETKTLSKQLKKVYEACPRYILSFTHDEFLQGKVQRKEVATGKMELISLQNL